MHCQACSCLSRRGARTVWRRKIFPCTSRPYATLEITDQLVINYCMKLQRWQRRKHARIPEILDAALACFAEKGFAGTRMDDIAARAGISKGTIYLYFDSKDAVFKALARQSIGAQLENVMAHVKAAQGSSAELLRFV